MGRGSITSMVDFLSLAPCEVTSVKQGGRWQVEKKVVVQLWSARGQGRRKKARHQRVDLRVQVEGWGQVLWHMLLAWHCTHHVGLTRRALVWKEAAHLNDNPRVVDFRQVAIVDKE